MPNQCLLVLTSAVNLVCLIASLWLGFYIVTRSPRRPSSWLAGATLWSLAGSFLNYLTYIHGPPQQVGLPWWWGWSVALTVPFWFHLSVALLPPEVRSPWRRRAVPLLYLLALNLVAIEAYTPWVFSGVSPEPPIYNNAQRPGPLYPLFGLYLIAGPAMSLWNLLLGQQAARHRAMRRQFALLAGASVSAILGALYATSSTWLGWPTPSFMNSGFLGIGVVLLGCGVARYNALVEGRALRHDFIYTALAAGLVATAYMLAAQVSRIIFGVPFVAFVFVIALAIASHSLYDWGRICLDRLLYRRQRGELRANLRQIVHTSASYRDIQEQLGDVLRLLAESLAADRALVALAADQDALPIVAQWAGERQIERMPCAVLDTDETLVLETPLAVPGFGSIDLVVPMQVGGERIGVVALGGRPSALAYSDDDVIAVEDVADLVASALHTLRSQERSVERISELAQEVRSREAQLQAQMRHAMEMGSQTAVLEGYTQEETVSLVEDALRHLNDYAYLGDLPMADLRLVDAHLGASEGRTVTHLDRGRGLHGALLSVLERLRPSGPRPSLPTREWHHYVVLHDCYVEGRTNREVMADLYIGEGTFHRARRRAVKAVARALLEMGRQAPTH